MARQHDRFMQDEIEHSHHVSYGDGFRFGIGVFVAFVLGSTLLGGIATAVALLLNGLK